MTVTSKDKFTINISYLSLGVRSLRAKFIVPSELKGDPGSRISVTVVRAEAKISGMDPIERRRIMGRAQRSRGLSDRRVTSVGWFTRPCKARHCAVNPSSNERMPGTIH